MAQFSTGVRIPLDVDAQVNGVPSYRPTLARTPDVGGAFGAAGEELERATSTLGKVLATQAEHKTILAAASAEEQLKDDFNQIRLDAQRLPGDQQAQYVASKTSDRAKQFLADPANADITRYMETRIPVIQGVVVRDAQESGAVATVKEHQAQNDALDQKIAANDVAGSFSVGPDGRFVDGPQAVAAREQVYNRYDALWPGNPVMAAALKRDFDAKVVAERARYIAQHPDASHPTALVDYIDQNRADITPEMEMQLHNMQTASINEPMRQQEADWTAMRLASIRYQQDFIAKNGHPDMARLESDAQWKRIAPEDYQRFSGQQYVEPTPSSVLAGYQSQINNANSEDELTAIKANIGFSAANRIINGRDAGPLALLAEERLQHLKTTAGAADTTQTERIRQFYEFTGSPSDMVVRAKNSSALSNAHEAAMAIYKSETAGHPQDPAVYRKAADDAMKAVPKPDWKDPETKSTTPTPTALTGYSDDQLRKIAEVIKNHPELMK